MKKLVLFTILSAIMGCGTAQQQLAVVKIKGSDTMYSLNRLLAEEFMLMNPGISVYVEGGGTGSGVKALINGTTDICSASRALRPAEAKLLADYYGSLGLFYLIAKDALSVFVNEDNPVNNLSLGDLKKIFTCEITNWKEVGGKDEPIMIVNRNFNSGTYLYFKEHILEGEEYCSSEMIEPTNEAVVNSVIEFDNAIGYGGITFGEGIKILTIDGIEPNETNARNDKYPITRYLHYFTTKTPSGATKKFIDWTLKPEGQRIVKRAGFISLWDVSR